MTANRVATKVAQYRHKQITIKFQVRLNYSRFKRLTSVKRHKSPYFLTNERLLDLNIVNATTILCYCPERLLRRNRRYISPEASQGIQLMSKEAVSSIILNHFLPYRMVNLAKRVSDSCSTIYVDEFGLSISEWRILARLGEQSGLNAKDIGDITAMDKSKVSRAVKLLEAKGYLVKEKDQKDSRVYYLSLSQEGIELYRDIAPKALEWESELLDVLSTTEYRDLMRIMKKLDARLDQMED